MKEEARGQDGRDQEALSPFSSLPLALTLLFPPDTVSGYPGLWAQSARWW